MSGNMWAKQLAWPKPTACVRWCEFRSASNQRTTDEPPVFSTWWKRIVTGEDDVMDLDAIWRARDEAAVLDGVGAEPSAPEAVPQPQPESDAAEDELVFDEYELADGCADDGAGECVAVPEIWFEEVVDESVVAELEAKWGADDGCPSTPGEIDYDDEVSSEASDAADRRYL